MLTNNEINPPLPDESETLVKRTLETAPQESCPPYKARLNCWAIIRIEPIGDQIVERFRSHSDADGRLRLLQQKFPTEKFKVVFEKQDL